MALTGSDKAYTYARSGLARSGATRSNYVTAWSTVDLIVRDGAGTITSRTDITAYIRAGSLRVTQALNDQADTCSFQLVPTAPETATPQIGQELAVAWTPGDVLFQGYALVVQLDRRPQNESPWVSVQCQDSLWRFDAQIVTYRFPAQSVSLSIASLIEWFCNTSAVVFTTTFVQPDMPSIASVEVINERPTTVMRKLLAAVSGAFYIQGYDVHAWAGSLSEPARTNPQPLTNTLATLKTFRETRDGTQLRKRVLVEGRRTETLIPYPAMPGNTFSLDLGLPIADASIFTPDSGPEAIYLSRIGSQWLYLRDPIVAAPHGANAPQTTTHLAFTPGDPALVLEAMPVAPPARGWVRVGGQYTRYRAMVGDPLTGVFQLVVPDATAPYGVLTVPIPVGETVEWVDAVMGFDPLGVTLWLNVDPAIRAQPPNTPVVTLVEVSVPFAGWPVLESFVQDGRYSYPGATARATADLAAFADPLVAAAWETEDLNAQPGRSQAITFTGANPMTATVTITGVALTFPLRTQPPRRRCTGGDVKPSTFFDLVLTDDS